LILRPIPPPRGERRWRELTEGVENDAHVGDGGVRPPGPQEPFAGAFLNGDRWGESWGGRAAVWTS